MDTNRQSRRSIDTNSHRWRKGAQTRSVTHFMSNNIDVIKLAASGSNLGASVKQNLGIKVLGFGINIAQGAESLSRARCGKRTAHGGQRFSRYRSAQARGEGTLRLPTVCQ